MTTLWLEEKEKKQVAHNQDDLLWGKGITDMVSRVVAATEHDHHKESTAGSEDCGQRSCCCRREKVLGKAQDQCSTSRMVDGKWHGRHAEAARGI